MSVCQTETAAHYDARQGDCLVRLNVKGKVRNTQLAQDKALFPMFEAVVNSFQAIEETQALTAPSLQIVVERDSPSSVLSSFTPHVDGFTVIDNGAGFNPDNLDSFFTSDTEYKLSKGGKGVGRFLWLKAFDHAEIESHYLHNGLLLTREFRFTENAEPPTAPATLSRESHPRTVVRLMGMRTPWKATCLQSLPLIGHRLIEHCLPFFLDPNCPSVSISDAEESIDLNKYFRENFEARASEHRFTLGGSDFRLRGLHLHGPHAKEHRLLYAANFREVTHENLERYLPNLQKTLTDDSGVFVYLGFLEGEYFDRSVYNERTAFVTASEGGDLFGDITIPAIRTAALPFIRADLEPFLTEIKTAKRATIDNYISQEAPQYRPLRRYLDEFIDDIPPGATGTALELALHEQLFEKQRELKQESHELLAEATQESLKPDEYEAKLNDFIERSNELGKSSLAEYVAHRRVILEFLEKSLKVNLSTGKYPLEDVIHRIIYPMRTTSDDVPYEQQNLWIIDERLAYHEFLASDVQLRSMRPLATGEAMRPDIIIFDRPLSFSEGSSRPLTSLVIVEFKKPDPDVRVTRPGKPDSAISRETPLNQVYDMIRKIKAGHFRDKNGVEIKVQAQSIPVYVYVICQMTAELETICEDAGMIRTPDNMGFFDYNPNPNITAYVEVISYDKLLNDAKKRNRVLFEKLNLPGM